MTISDSLMKPQEETSVPYVKQIDRPRLDHGEPARNAGELNYVITGILDAWLSEHGRNYAAINNAVGVIELVKTSPADKPTLSDADTILGDSIVYAIAAFDAASGEEFLVATVTGVLECAKLELYRRIAAPYEDTKIEENGDVYSEAVLV